MNTKTPELRNEWAALHLTIPFELLRCPWCGSDNLRQAWKHGMHYVACCGCNTNGPARSTASSAVLAWNTRHFGAKHVEPQAE